MLAAQRHLCSPLLSNPLFFLSQRTVFMPPSNVPYAGIYRTNGEICRQDDILVCQPKMNYHPGANVRWQSYRKLNLLKANCDGTVVITREECNPDRSIEIMEKTYPYSFPFYKLTFNVIPRQMSNTFVLVDEE